MSIINREDEDSLFRRGSLGSMIAGTLEEQFKKQASEHFFGKVLRHIHVETAADPSKKRITVDYYITMNGKVFLIDDAGKLSGKRLVQIDDDPTILWRYEVVGDWKITNKYPSISELVSGSEMIEKLFGIKLPDETKQQIEEQ
jgi:hypothetical protein